MSEEKEVFELNTGIIPAAIYATKLRRSVIAILGKKVPTNTIVRDVAELNKSLYNKIVEELKIGKTDPIRITLKIEYDKNNDKLNFFDIKISRYIEEEVLKKKYEDELMKLSEQLAMLDKKLDEQKKNYEAELKKLKEDLEFYKKENEKFKEAITKVLVSLKALLS